jgi:hypothetical protein
VPFILGMMLLTMSLGASETARWSSDAELREEIKAVAAKRALKAGRRFYQISTDTGRILVVGEASTAQLGARRVR